MIMLPFTQYLLFLRAPKFTCGNWPHVISGARRIVKNRAILICTRKVVEKPIYPFFNRILHAYYFLRIIHNVMTPFLSLVHFPILLKKNIQGGKYIKMFTFATSWIRILFNIRLFCGLDRLLAKIFLVWFTDYKLSLNCPHWFRHVSALVMIVQNVVLTSMVVVR